MSTPPLPLARKRGTVLSGTDSASDNSSDYHSNGSLPSNVRRLLEQASHGFKSHTNFRPAEESEDREGGNLQKSQQDRAAGDRGFECIVAQVVQPQSELDGQKVIATLETNECLNVFCQQGEAHSFIELEQDKLVPFSEQLGQDYKPKLTEDLRILGVVVDTKAKSSTSNSCVVQ
jgi:hypothetical protein